MTYEEKMIRYIVSKMIQKKFFGLKHRMPSEKELAYLIGVVLEDIQAKYKQFSLVRRHSKTGLLTPLLREFVNNLHI